MTRVGAAALVVLAAVGCTSRTTAAPLATVTVAHGPFEIVAAGRRIGAGGFPNNGGNPFATVEVTGFTVRYRGQPVTITHGPVTLADFWRVVKLPDAPQPALLASTTDFHLITEQDGHLVTRSFGAPSTDMADYQWLDSESGQPGAPKSFGIEKVDEQGMELRGGRYLRLSHHTVLDVKTLQSFAIRPWIESGTGLPMAGLNGGNVRAIAFSPGRTQYATIGSGYDYEGDGEHYEALLVVDLPSGDAYGLRLDRKHTHFVDLDDATLPWIEHYFRWTRDAAGHERLAARADAKPLPWTGRLVTFGGGDVEYRVRPVRESMRPVLNQFVVERMGATEAPNWIDPSRPSDGTFKVTGCPGVVATTFSENHVGIFVPSGPGERAPCMEAVRRIAAAFDADLARGKYQDQFVEE